MVSGIEKRFDAVREIFPAESSGILVIHKAIHEKGSDALAVAIDMAPGRYEKLNRIETADLYRGDMFGSPSDRSALRCHDERVLSCARRRARTRNDHSLSIREAHKPYAASIALFLEQRHELIRIAFMRDLDEMRVDRERISLTGDIRLIDRESLIEAAKSDIGSI
jgi:hypothetical protein